VRLVHALAHFAPVVRVDRVAVLHLLRRAGNVDERRQKPVLHVPEEHAVDVVVFDPFNRTEVGVVCLSIHHGRTVRVNCAAVIRDHRVSESVGELRRLAILPRLRGSRRNPGCRKSIVFGRLHDVRIVRRILAVRLARRGMGMRRGDDDFVERELGQGLAHRFLEDVEERLPNDDGVHADHKRLIERLVAVARFHRHDVGRHGAGDTLGDPGIELPGEKHGLVGSDVARRGAYMERGGAGLRGGINSDERQESTGATTYGAHGLLSFVWWLTIRNPFVGSAPLTANERTAPR